MKEEEAAWRDLQFAIFINALESARATKFPRWLKDDLQSAYSAGWTFSKAAHEAKLFKTIKAKK